jgi:Ca2+-binding EF-hand superfamily protein
MAELNELEQGKLKDLFDRMDADGDGLITPDDLKQAFADAGFELDDEQADALIARADPDGEGTVNFENFVACILIRGAIRRRLLVLLALFRELDTDDSGFITPDNLKEIVAQTGAEVTDEQIDNLVAAIDQNDEGQISFKEFVGALLAVLKAKAEAEGLEV